MNLPASAFADLPASIVDAFHGRATLTFPEVAAVLEIDIKTLRGHRHAGNLPVHIKGTGLTRRHYVCTLHDVATFLRNAARDLRPPDVIPEQPENLPAPAPPIRRAKIKSSSKPMNRKRGFIYFVTDGDFIKIGWSKNWKKRVAILQVSNPKPLSVLGVCTGTPLAENWLHQCFESYRINGEWHRNHPDILGYIAEMKRVDAAAQV